MRQINWIKQVISEKIDWIPKVVPKQNQGEIKTLSQKNWQQKVLISQQINEPQTVTQVGVRINPKQKHWKWNKIWVEGQVIRQNLKQTTLTIIVWPRMNHNWIPNVNQVNSKIFVIVIPVIKP